MAEEISGRGDPVKTLQLLWDKVPEPRRGPRPKLALGEIVAAAVAIADAEGLEAVTTRRVAEAVGISPMSFYTYVPGKAELLDLMLDAVADVGQVPPEGWDELDWRARLEIIAWGLWSYSLKHPWTLQVESHRPVLGPNTMAAYELALSAVDGIGLDALEMDMAVTALANLVFGTVRGAAREKRVQEATGMSDEQWWRTIEPFLETLDYSPYPVSSRVGPVAGETYGVHDPDRALRFALERFLDGLALLIERRRG